MEMLSRKNRRKLCFAARVVVLATIRIFCTKEIPQTVLALRGSNGVGIEAAMAGGWIRSWTCPLIFVAIYSTW